MSAVTKTEQQEAIDHLTSADGYNIKPGDTIYTNTRNDSGTQLKLFVVKPNNQGEYVPFDITWYAARAIGTKPYDRKGSEWVIRNPVYGMDRGFDLVYRLARSLFPGDDTQTNSGYALNHRWL